MAITARRRVSTIAAVVAASVVALAPGIALGQGALTNGGNHSGAISVPQEIDAWTLEVTAGDAIYLRVAETTDPDTPFVPMVRLQHPNGTILGGGWGPRVGTFHVDSAPVTGTYNVLISSNVSAINATGPYRLTVAKIPGAFIVAAGDDGGPMTNGANHAGAIHLGDFDLWTFTAAAGDSLILGMGVVGTPDPGFVLSMTLFGPTGNGITAAYGERGGQISIPAPATGTYTILVRTEDTGRDGTGNYRVTLAKVPGTFVVPSGDEGGSMVNGANHPGVIHLGDLDSWTFAANAGDSVFLSVGEIESQPDPGFVPWIRLYGPNGARVGSLTQGIGVLVGQISVIAPVSGTYTVVVSTGDSGLDAIGEYRLTLAKIPGDSIVPANDEGGPMVNGAEHPGAIHLGDLDMWTFQAARNTPLTVTIRESVAEPDPDFFPYIRLLSPSGVLVSWSWGPTTATINVNAAPESGTYTVLVTTGDSGNDATGRYVLSVNGALTLERIAIGLGPQQNDGGWFATRNGVEGGLGPAGWGRLPWPAYNATGGGLHIAAGDVDGDGLDEIVAGLGRGSGGWIAVFDDAVHNHRLLQWIRVQWPAYNAANGEVWPAVGDIDGDGRDEIVAGLGAGGFGWYEIFDDEPASFAHVAWRQVAWPAYAAMATSETHPAIGNVDGAGASEIVIGLGSGSAGWIAVVNGAASNYSHRSWFQVRWSTYTAANGTVYPASGDVDGDGRDEIVAGLGSGGGGWLQVFDDAAGAFAHVQWLRTSWPTYNASSGETHPAVGNVDGDVAAEIVVGLAEIAGNGGWFETLDNQTAGFASVGWRNLGWPAFTAAGGATYPAIGRLR